MLGVAEAVEFGLFARLVPSKGWVPCSVDDQGAEPDLNRLRVLARWDPAARRFVLR